MIDAEDDLPALKYSKAPIWVALCVTIFMFIAIGLLAFGRVEVGGSDVSRWQQFLLLTPNEMGDALAGVGATLTLVWVVASVFQQSLELRAQREEFQRMVRQQQKQLQLSADQGGVLGRIENLTSDGQTRERYKAELANFKAYMASDRPYTGSWYIKERDLVVKDLNHLGQAFIAIDDRAYRVGESDSVFLRLVQKGFSDFLRDISNLFDQGYITIGYPNIRDILKHLLSKVSHISELGASSADLAMSDDFDQLRCVEKALKNIINEDRLWTDNGWKPAQ